MAAVAASKDGTATGRLTLAGYDIEAGSISIAGLETCIILPQLRLVFDTGRCPHRAVYQRTVLLTHAHMDHIGGLPFHISTREMLGLSRTVVVLPSEVAAATENLLAAHRALDGSDMPCDIIPLSPGGQEYKSGHYVYRPFRTFHPVPSQGYVVYSQKHKLKPEYRGLPGPDIRDLKAAGEAITEMVETAESAFTGDTSAAFLTAPGSKDALKAKLLIMEATFLDDDVSLEHAQKYGHMHIREIAAHADKFQNEAILLTHFSQRYTAERILKLLDTFLPQEFRKKCTPLLTGFH